MKKYLNTNLNGFIKSLNINKINTNLMFFSTLLEKTALYDYHKNELKARMINFSGFEMPVQYNSILKEHFACRESAALFDVSHMGQVKVSGKDRIEFIESLCVSDIKELKEGSGLLTTFTNDRGGIIDDSIVTNMKGYLSLVFNAGRKLIDIKNLIDHKNTSTFKDKDVTIEHLTDRSLIAFQGPKSATILQKYLTANLNNLGFLEQAVLDIPQLQEKVAVMRCGYTGEDGFELSVSNNNAVKLFDMLYKNSINEGVLPAGLGARDTLRLEAGLCLYGHDTNEDTSPVEANLRWLIGKRRKTEGGFKGYDTIKEQLKNYKNLEKKRIGFMFINDSGPPAREGCLILDNSENNNVVGIVTSGSLSPILRKNIGMGYINVKDAKPGDNLKVKVRNNMYDIIIAKTPFVPSNYYRK